MYRWTLQASLPHTIPTSDAAWPMIPQKQPVRERRVLAQDLRRVHGRDQVREPDRHQKEEHAPEEQGRVSQEEMGNWEPLAAGGALPLDLREAGLPHREQHAGEDNGTVTGIVTCSDSYAGYLSRKIVREIEPVERPRWGA